MPPVVNSAMGISSQIGVQEGWTLKSYDGIAVTGDFNIFLASFTRSSVEKLPGPPVLPMVFELPNLEVWTIFASQQPLTMTLDIGLPVVVAKVEGYSEMLGVRPSW